VYEINCDCGLCYVGTTKIALKTRIKEHISDIEKKKETTALAQHVAEKGHKPDFQNVKVLDREKRENTRLTLENLRIQQKGDKAVNSKDDKDKLVYSVIL